MLQTAPTQTLPRWGGLLQGIGGGRVRKSKQMIKFARALRRNANEAEKRLWYHLRARQLDVKFRRQEPIGPYIADFMSYESKLIVELDGGQHSASEQDIWRDQFFAELGFKTIRFWNFEVFENLDGVILTIQSKIAEQIKPSPSGEGLGGGD